MSDNGYNLDPSGPINRRCEYFSALGSMSQVEVVDIMSFTSNKHSLKERRCLISNVNLTLL